MTESPQPRKQSRKDRLIALIALLRDGEFHRAGDLAEMLGVTPRTLYRDMDTLMQSGVPIRGTRGVGYCMTEPVTLPPLNLSMAELEALHLGLAVMTEADDRTLRTAARDLAAKIDAALPENRVSDTTAWGLSVYPFADTASGIRHIPQLRDALRSRARIQLVYREQDGNDFESVVKVLKLDYWGRVWTCTVWCERAKSLRTLRLDRISAIGPAGVSEP